jgi:tetratricopeptide (TPR) repeat protein
MMLHRNVCARVNVIVLGVVVVAVAAIGVAVLAARQIHRTTLSETYLRAGKTAFENKDWPEASKNFKKYLGQNPDDVEVLRKYAEACLSTRPLDAHAVSGAIAAYRRIARLAPVDEVAYAKLATLYTGIGNFEELAHIARARLEHDPNNRKAPLWLAEALIRLNKPEDANQVLEKCIGKLDALPNKHVEYVQACSYMSEIALAGGSNGAKTKALEWLNKAVDYAPDSSEALTYRAMFYRQATEIPGIDENDRLTFARKDLESSDARGTDNPRICLLLATEWLAHGELDRTAAELEAGKYFSQEALEQQFFDVNEWVIARFLLSTELLRRRGTTAEAASLADKALSSLTEQGHRVRVLPSAILLYVAAGKAPEARRCLDEYLGIVRTQKEPVDSPQRLAGLRALVAGAENRPYAVIDALTPTVGTGASNPELLRMLTEAYSKTDQAGRAINVLNQYRRLNPQDPHATLELAKQYFTLGDWKRAYETASTAESPDSLGLALKLLCVGARVNMAVGQRGHADAGEIQKLAAELWDLRQAQPDSVGIRLLQATLADHLGQPQEAERELKLAIEECKEPLTAEMQLAVHYGRMKRTDEAIAVCEAACKRHPKTAGPWLWLSGIHVDNSDYEAARRCLKEGLNAITEPQEKRSISIKLAVLEIVHGDQAAGISLLREMAAQDKQEVQARVLLLGIGGIQEDPVEAERLVGELRQVEGENGILWRLHQASLWLSLENWRSKQQAIVGLLQFCTEAYPAWPAPALLLAEMYGRLGDVKHVEDIYRQALAEDPFAADVANRLLTLLEKQGRFSDAEKVLQQTAVSPQIASAWQIRIALGMGDSSRAIDELKIKAASDDKDATSRIQLARLVYQQTKDTDQAFKYLKEAEAIASNTQALIAVKVSILKAEGKTTEARQVLDDYVADHNDYAAYWMRAAYLAKMGDLERAEKDYTKLTTFASNSEAAYELLSGFYAGTGRLDQGIAAAEQGLSDHSKSLSLKRNLMRLLLRRGRAQDRERAIEILAALEEQLPQDAELMTLRAWQMLEQSTPQSLASAREKLENAVNLEPTAVNAHLLLIRVAMQQGQYKAACDYAIRAIGSNPRNSALLLARGQAELALGYGPMAARLAREVLQQDPNSTEALSLLADGAFNSKDRNLLQEARTQIDSAVGRDPKNERLLLSRARVLIALELPKMAIPELEVYCQTKEGRNSVAALLAVANLYRVTGDADRSEQKIEQAQRVDPNNQAVTHARLVWLVTQKRFEELKGISSAYLSAKEQDPEILLSAASILTGSNSGELKKEGLKLYEHAATLSPTSADVCLGLASTLYQTGDAERAEKCYRQWLEKYPDSVRALNDLAWILQEHYQRYDAALEFANKGLRLAPDNLDLLDTRGTILANLPDRLADAKNDWGRLAELSPAKTREKAKALLQLGRVCARLDDFPQAKQHLQNALEIDREINVFTAAERAEITTIVQQTGTQGDGGS